MRRALLAFLFGAWLLASAAPATASDDVQSLLSKYIGWRGGPRFEALQSIHSKGRIRLGEIDGQFEQWLARDGRMHRQRTLGPVSEVEAVSAGSSWKTNLSGQIEDLADAGQSERETVALAFADLGKPRSGTTYSLLGTEHREERDWSIVRVSFHGTDSADLFLDAATGELLGERITQDRAARFVRYADWRVVSGIRLPFEERVTSSNPGAGEYTRVDSVELNAIVPTRLLARPAPARNWRFSSGRHSTGWVDFEFFNEDQIFIPATLNGRAVNLILDSGADTTVLDKSFAATIGATLSAAIPVTGTGGQATMQLAPGLEIRLGELALHGITAGVIDLSAMAGQLGHPLPLVLGKEVFNQLLVDIDFPNRRIAFHEPAGFAAPPGAVRVPLGRHAENRTVPASVEGGAAVDFDFDLGSNSPLIVYPAYRDNAHLLDGRRYSLGLSAGVGGMIKPKCATLNYIVLGGARIGEVPADFPDAADSTLNSDRTAGNIGLPVFSRFRLITDYPHDAIWLEANPEALAKPFRKNRSGLIALPDGDHLNVLLVAPGSPAEQGGWKAGAQIIAVNGHKIDSGYRSSTLSRWSAQAPGIHVMLTLADATTREIVLADYY